MGYTRCTATTFFSLDNPSIFMFIYFLSGTLLGRQNHLGLWNTFLIPSFAFYSRAGEPKEGHVGHGTGSLFMVFLGWWYTLELLFFLFLAMAIDGDELVSATELGIF
jgi:hypothetical protein